MLYASVLLFVPIAVIYSWPQTSHPTPHRTLANVSPPDSLKNALKHPSNALTTQTSPLCDPHLPPPQKHTLGVCYRRMRCVSVRGLVQAVFKMLFRVLLSWGQRSFTETSQKCVLNEAAWQCRCVLEWPFYSYNYIFCLILNVLLFAFQPFSHISTSSCLCLRWRTVGRRPSARNWKWATSSLT